MDADSSVPDGTGDAISYAIGRVIDPVQGMHEAIAGSVVAHAGPRFERLHQSVTQTVYCSVRLAGSALGAGTEAVFRRRGHSGSGVRAVIEALWGDELHRQGVYPGPAVAIDEGCAAEKTANIVVLVHGLGEGGKRWRPEFLGLLRTAGQSPIVVRYNTGRAVRESGHDLAEVIEEAIRDWPVPVEQIALVGYSLGGLVARSAIEEAKANERAWAKHPLKLITIGTPHRGSPIAKGAALAAAGLSAAPQTLALARFLGGRSAGLRDLDHGVPSEDGALDGVPVLVIAGVITTSVGNPVGVLFGDAIVRQPSALGRRRRRSLPTNAERVVGGRNHFSLTEAPEVRDEILAWLVPPPGPSIQARPTT